MLQFFIMILTSHAEVLTDKLPDVSKGILDISLNGLVVEDELEVADILQVDLGAVGQQRSKLLLNRTFEVQHLPIARILHQTFDKVRYLLKIMCYNLVQSK